MDYNVAVIMAIYKNDKLEDFQSALESITIKQKGVNLKRIRVYLHVDGPIDDDIKQYVVNSSLVYSTIYTDVAIGLSKGLNKLINSLEDEKYILRMDSDDISCFDRILKQISYMDNHKEIGVLGGTISEFIESVENTVATRCYPLEHNDIFRCISKASPFAHVTVCFRKSDMDNIGLYPTQYPLNEDIALWAQILFSTVKCANLNDVLVHVRMDNAYSRRNYSKAISEFKVYFNIMIRKKNISIFPFVRFVFRLFPISIVGRVYRSKIRMLVIK